MSRRTRKTINQMNVVPYIDVMLVLLIIFMITAPLISPGEIQLPTVGTQLPAPQGEPLEITVNADGSYQIAERPGTKSSVKLNREQMLARVRDVVAKDPQRAVVIRGDKAARYESVVTVLDLMYQNGVKRVGLLAQSTK
jgi:biopolymer transport protein TolR